jgi:hypothetical protein
MNGYQAEEFIALYRKAREQQASELRLIHRAIQAINISLLAILLALLFSGCSAETAEGQESGKTSAAAKSNGDQPAEAGQATATLAAGEQSPVPAPVPASGPEIVDSRASSLKSASTNISRIAPAAAPAPPVYRLTRNPKFYGGSAAAKCKPGVLSIRHRSGSAGYVSPFWSSQQIPTGEECRTDVPLMAGYATADFIEIEYRWDYWPVDQWSYHKQAQAWVYAGGVQ